MSGIELGYSYELGSGQTRIGVLTRPRKRSGMVMTSDFGDRVVPDKLGNFDPFSPIVLLITDVSTYMAPLTPPISNVTVPLSLY